MRAQCITVHSVLSGDRTVAPVSRRVAVKTLAPKTDLPFICIVNGEVLLRENDGWNRKVRDGDLVAFVVHPGGGGGSNPTALILTVALMVVAPQLGGLIATNLGIEGGIYALGNAITVGQVIGTGIALVGKLAINALMGTPQMPSSHSLPQASPTYSLGAQGNRARLAQAIPEWFGHHMVYPDLAAAPYTEYSGNDQYLHQLFCLGQGEYEIDAMRVGDTDIESFGEISYEVVPPGGDVTLFPTNVLTADEVGGQELLPAITIDYTGTNVSFDSATKKLTVASGTPFASIEFSTTKQSWYVQISGSANAANNGVWRITAKTNNTLTLDNQYMVTEGAGASVHLSTPYIGPFALNPAGTSTDKFSVDAVFPKGLFRIDSDGDMQSLSCSIRFEFRKIDDSGNPLGAWFALSPNYTSAGTVSYSQSLSGDGVTTIFNLNSTAVVSSSLTVTVNGVKTAVTFSNNTGPGGVDQIIFSTPPKKPTSTTSYNNGVIVYGGTPNIKVSGKISTNETDEYWTLKTTTAQRYTLNYVMPTPGRYEARGRRTYYKHTSTRYVHDVIWSAARAYFYAQPDYGDVTLLALRMRATNNLSQRSSQLFNVIGTRKLPIWNGATWSAPVATRSIAWALAYICKTRLPDAHYDLAWLLAMDAVWSDRGDTFNGIFDSEITFGEALSLVARAGRAKWYQHGMVIRFFRDEAKAVPTAIFNSRNTVKGSFSTDYLMYEEETADCIEVEFFNEQTWQIDYVMAQLPGSTTDRPAKLRFFGVTNREQAWREGMYECAANRYRRILPRLTTEMEGFIPLPGDLVAVQRNIAGWGSAGDVVSYNAGTRDLVSSEPLIYGNGTHYIAFKRRDGSFDGPYTIFSGSDAYHHTIGSALDFTPDVDFTRERTSFVFGNSTDFYMPCRVMGLRPRNMTQVDISFVVEDAAVHTADSGVSPPESTRWNLPITISRPTVTGISVALGGTSSAPLALIAWTPAPDAEHYRIEQSFDDGETWGVVGVTYSSNLTLPAHMGTMMIRVAGVGLTAGEPTVWIGDPYIYAPADVTGFTATPNGRVVTLTWNPNPDIDLLDYQIRYGATWDTGVAVGTIVGEVLDVPAPTIGTHTWWIAARDLYKSLSETPVSAELVVTAPLAPDISYTVALTDMVLTWTVPASQFTINNYELRHGADWATGTFVARVAGNAYQVPVTFGGSRNFMVAAVDAAGNYGAPDSITVVIVPPQKPTVTTQVVDNNVLLYWTDAAQTLPVLTYEIRRGDVYSSAEVIGTKSGLFTVVFETLAGTFTYWVTGVDSAGNYGTPGSVAATVSQPPDYVLEADHDSVMAGTLSNAMVELGAIILPVNTTETYAEHFTSHGWNTPDDQIAAGYPIFIEPTVGSGYYEDTYDYGTVLANCKVTCTPNYEVVAGTPAVTYTLSLSANGSSWTDYPNQTEIFGTNFRYVKFRITVGSTGGDDLVRILGLNYRLDVKLKNDAGMVACVNTDNSASLNSANAGGTTVLFNVPFIDVSSITVSPVGTTAAIAIYDFIGSVAYPEGFKVYLFNTSGVRISGTVSWSVKGF